MQICAKKKDLIYDERCMLKGLSLRRMKVQEEGIGRRKKTSRLPTEKEYFDKFDCQRYEFGVGFLERRHYLRGKYVTSISVPSLTNGIHL